MTEYLTGRNKQIRGLLSALNIPYEGVTSLSLIVEPDQFVRVEIERLVTDTEMHELTQWILKHGVKAEQLDD
jgi:hypothetical protein